MADDEKKKAYGFRVSEEVYAKVLEIAKDVRIRPYVLVDLLMKFSINELDAYPSFGDFYNDTIDLKIPKKRPKPKQITLAEALGLTTEKPPKLSDDESIIHGAVAALIENKEYLTKTGKPKWSLIARAMNQRNLLSPRKKEWSAENLRRWYYRKI